MYRIIEKEQLTETIIRMDIEAPWIARSGQPGQFVIVIPHDKGERVPLTISDINYEKNSVSIVYQIVGDSTRRLAAMNEGDCIFTIVGPLGRRAEVMDMAERNKTENKPLRILFVAGGVGTAPVYPQAKWAHANGIGCDVIIGSRNKELIFFEEKMRDACDNLYVVTDDGSYGEKGLVTDKIKQLIERGEKYDVCVAIGPLPMMKFVSLLTKQYNLETVVSLNAMMVDGTGMCGACRVSVGDKVKFTCVDGPEFDGHKVDFDEAMKRLARHDTKKYRIATCEEGHRCNLAPAVEKQIAAEKGQRPHPQEQDPSVRIHNFKEVSNGINHQQALVEAARCLHCKKPLCVASCPVNINIPEFIAAVKADNIFEAGRIIAADSSLPAICGRVCPQETQCEGSCVLGHKSKPIAIGALERFVADWNRENNKQDIEATLNSSQTSTSDSQKKKVAIIGSGPSGLACASDLAKAGIKVTIFEALQHPGGVLVYGIPEFRLPKKKVVEPEIENLKKLGVEIKTNVIVGRSISIDELFKDGFEAIYIASGAGLPKFMKIPGETLVGVVAANELLTRTNLMHGYDKEYDTPIILGKHVVVVGGGNVAMDAARTARRLGCDVTVVYRRGEQDMPARLEEIHHAKEEGIQFMFQVNPVAVIDDGKGNCDGVRLIRMAMGEPDASGRRSFSAIEGSEFDLAADNVVIALGTSPNPLIKSTTPGLNTESWGGIIVNDEGLTSRDRVYAGGDAVSGAATVILAMGAGRKAAKSIIEKLK